MSVPGPLPGRTIADYVILAGMAVNAVVIGLIVVAYVL